MQNKHEKNVYSGFQILQRLPMTLVVFFVFSMIAFLQICGTYPYRAIMYTQWSKIKILLPHVGD